MVKEKYEDFAKKIDHAEKILDIIELRESLTLLHKFRKNLPILQGLWVQKFRPIREMRSLVDQTINIALPLLLVYSVSCLEYFLSTSKQKNLREMISNCESKAGENLTRKIHEVRIKRNIVIHSHEQRLSQRALKDLNHHHITGYKLGQILELTPESVKVDLNSLRKFAEKIAFF